MVYYVSDTLADRLLKALCFWNENHCFDVESGNQGVRGDFESQNQVLRGGAGGMIEFGRGRRPSTSISGIVGAAASTRTTAISSSAAGAHDLITVSPTLVLSS